MVLAIDGWAVFLKGIFPMDDVIIDMFSRRSRPSNPSSSFSPSSSSGPIIREISDEEAEQSIPKRRKDLYGR